MDSKFLVKDQNIDYSSIVKKNDDNNNNQNLMEKCEGELEMENWSDSNELETSK